MELQATGHTLSTLPLPPGSRSALPPGVHWQVDLGTGWPARDGGEVGGGGSANLYLRREPASDRQEKKSSCYLKALLVNTESGPRPLAFPRSQICPSRFALLSFWQWPLILSSRLGLREQGSPQPKL